MHRSPHGCEVAAERPGGDSCASDTLVRQVEQARRASAEDASPAAYDLVVNVSHRERTWRRDGVRGQRSTVPSSPRRQHECVRVGVILELDLNFCSVSVIPEPACDRRPLVVACASHRRRELVQHPA